MKNLLKLAIILCISLTGAKAFASGGMDSYTVLMLHFNDGFGDESSGSHAVTTYGDAQIDTANKKFGAGSASFDGSGDYLSLPDSADWSFGSGDFTVDFWARFNDLTADPAMNFVSQYVDNVNFWSVKKQSPAPSIRNKLQMYFESTGVKGDYRMTWGWTDCAVNTWYHLAFVRSGNTGYIFIDGGLQAITEVTPFSNVGDIAAPLHIAELIGSGYVNGYLDEFRISKGIARWTSNFTPPTEEYGSDAVIPEPSSLLLLGIGLIGLIKARFKQ